MQYFIDPLGAQYSEDKTVLASIPKGLERYEIIEGYTHFKFCGFRKWREFKRIGAPYVLQNVSHRRF